MTPIISNGTFSIVEDVHAFSREILPEGSDGIVITRFVAVMCENSECFAQ